MAAINHLPDEIVFNILSNLFCPDLASTSRASQHLHAISEPLLYGAPCIITTSRTPHSLQIFLRTLLALGRESLATQVHSLTLQWDHQQCAPAYTPEITVAESRLGLHPYRLRGQDIQLVILLHLLPRLRVLNYNSPHNSYAFHRFMNAQRDVPPTALPLALRSLREFRCVQLGSEPGLTVQTIQTILGLPSIRTVDVHVTDRYELKSPDAASSAVTDLRLSYVNASPGR